MEKTGVYFEMTETFTLENMFAMELDKHADVLNEIVTAAIKEIAIEKVGLLPGRPGWGGGRGVAATRPCSPTTRAWATREHAYWDGGLAGEAASPCRLCLF